MTVSVSYKIIIIRFVIHTYHIYTYNIRSYMTHIMVNRSNCITIYFFLIVFLLIHFFLFCVGNIFFLLIKKYMHLLTQLYLTTHQQH